MSQWLELVLVERAALDEQLAEGSPRVLDHGDPIGTGRARQ